MSLSTLEAVVHDVSRWAVFVAFILILSSQNSLGQSEKDSAPPSIEAALGIQPSLNRLSTLVQQGEGGSVDATNLRQDILEKVMQASFDFDSVLSRIQVEIAYTAETRRLLDNRAKRRESRYSLASFLAGGVTGAAGSAMGLTSNLGHSGTVVSLVGSGSVLALAVAHSAASDPKQQIQSPLNMLAQILGTTPNSKSSYPPTVTTLISVPGPEGGVYVSQLPGRWKQLERLQAEGRGKTGSSVASVTSDSDQLMLATADELSNREAMLLDLNAALLALRSRLGGILTEVRLR
jgi:hypothetical protein